MRARALLVVAALASLGGTGASEHTPAGVVAASVGETVVLLDPATRVTVVFPTGPVGWLYPAPGGVLFAPDLVNGRTSVLDLVGRTMRERLDGVTMPLFGEQADRYMVVAGGEVIVASYPERAVVTRQPCDVASPWQVILVPDETALLILDRAPEGGRAASLVALDLLHGQEVYRRQLEGDVVRMALSPTLGLLAVADATGSVCLLQPGGGLPVGCWPMPGSPRDLVFAGDPEQLAVAVATPAGAGTLQLMRFKHRPDGTEVRTEPTALAGAPVRLAADPSGAFLAVGLATGVELVELRHRRSLGVVPLEASPRDLAWCDPSRPGPLLPEWSDQKPPTLEMGRGPGAGR